MPDCKRYALLFVAICREQYQNGAALESLSYPALNGEDCARQMFNDWISAMSERHRGTHWHTKDDAVGECMDVWPMPESFTLRFPNGSRGNYHKAELVAA
jgi:hypothetical protein